MILVTGGTGFVGSYLIKDLLQSGEKVRATKRSTSTFEMLGNYVDQIEWIEADLNDIGELDEAMNGIEKVYHCAGFVSSHSNDYEKLIRINVEGTANVVNAALRSGAKKLLHVSSVVALGLPESKKPIDENYNAHTSKLQFDYFLSKRLAEMEVWRANAEGLETVIVNPGGITGAGHWQHEPLNVFNTVNGGLKFYTEGANGFIDVRDLSSLMIQLMNSEVNGERVIAVAESLPLKEFLSLTADALNVPPPTWRVTKWMSELAWRFEAVRAWLSQRPPDYTRDDLRISRIPFYYNNEKVKSVINREFISIRQSLNEGGALFLESKKKGSNYATFY
ncbi:MAG: NAD-dependent epimerase/dehydratase family protein [Bacteroidetes bacterium]|nr:NAD-dependent epimerase/dehydratase family protein [Bacteroidota bacterium]